MQYKFGQVVWAETLVQDGRGLAPHPCIILQDEGDRVQVLVGTSKKATQGALVKGEFLVAEQDERDVMGLAALPGNKTATRFSWARDSVQWLNKSLVRDALGVCSNNVLGRAMRAGMSVGALR